MDDEDDDDTVDEGAIPYISIQYRIPGSLRANDGDINDVFSVGRETEVDELLTVAVPWKDDLLEKISSVDGLDK